MAKGQKRSGREPKKPKKDKTVKGATSGSSLLPPPRPAPKSGSK